MGLKEWLIPQDKIFFELISQESELVLEAAEAFKDLIENYTNLEEKLKKIRILEHECDTVLHEVFTRLNRSFITPFDQEDISKLVSLYDDVLDLIDSVANKMLLFKVKAPDDVMKKSAQLILQMCKEVDGALRQIRKIKEGEIRKKFIEIHKLENEMDDLIDDSIAGLFAEKDPVKIIILKDIYDDLELIADKCEDVSLVIQDIVIKNA
jgi:predicted phosphate transport protein (TIGR00153 family)